MFLSYDLPFSFSNLFFSKISNRSFKISTYLLRLLIIFESKTLIWCYLSCPLEPTTGGILANYWPKWIGWGLNDGLGGQLIHTSALFTFGFKFDWISWFISFLNISLSFNLFTSTFCWFSFYGFKICLKKFMLLSYRLFIELSLFRKSALESR